MKRILITRSPHQASDLADRLRALGAEPILIPTIALEDPSTFEPLDTAIAALDQFNWLLFTSANAVEAFHKRAIAKGAPFIAMSGVESHLAMSGNAKFPRIAAIGPATALSIEKLLGRKPDLIPPRAVAESLAEVLLPHAKPGVRFLLVRAKLSRDQSARDPIPFTLRAAGAELTIAPAYRTVIPPGSAEQIKFLFAERDSWPDAITFTSSSTANNLFALLESAGLTLPPEILRASIGPITSQTLRDLGYPPQLEAAEATIPALVEILVKPLGLRKPS
jgi:uroporphyrinogen-III synthase